jgi:phage tail tape-measure protein
MKQKGKRGGKDMKQGLVVIRDTGDEKEIEIKPSAKGAATGAAAGASVGVRLGGPVGAVVGGVIGGRIGLIFGPED